MDDTARGTTTDRGSRPRHAPRLELRWLDLPNDGTDPATRLGTCLVLRSTGRRAPRRLELDLPSGARHVVEHPVRDAPVGIATPVQVARLVAIGTVFVDWESADGRTGSTWLRVPPVPARYRRGWARTEHTTDRDGRADVSGASGR